MSTKHTPGPWHADDGGGHYFGIFGEDGDPVAYLVEPKFPMQVHVLPLDLDGSPDGYRFAAEHEANARLIAAAPDMLEALKQVQSRMTGKEGRKVATWGDLQIVSRAIAAAESAGIKVEGPVKACGKTVPNMGFSSCTRDAGHEGDCRCNVGDVEARRAGKPVEG